MQQKYQGRSEDARDRAVVKWPGLGCNVEFWFEEA